MARKFFLLLLSILAATSHGMRFRKAARTLNREGLKLRSAANSTAESTARVAIAAGTTLRGRYVLDRRLYRRQLEAQRSNGDSEYSYLSPKVGSDFPDSMHFQDIPEQAEVNNFAHGPAAPEHLGKGSFGDVWKAYDLHRKHDVAIKFFFMTDEETGVDEYLTPSVAQKTSYDYYTYIMEDSVLECTEAIDIMSEESMDVDGAQRICQCFEEHVTSAEDHDPFFLVLELCGTALDEIYEKRSEQPDGPENSAAWVRNVIKEVAQGLRFLSSVHPPRVHHDLKLENIAVTDDGHIKLIDFGAMLPFEDHMEGGVCSPQYTPPEVLCAQGPSFRFPGRPFEYDVYSTGLMYWELVCNDRPGWDENSTAEAGYHLTSWIPEDKTCQRKKKGIGTPKDMEIIRDMMNEDPDLRPSPENVIEALAAINDTVEMEDNGDSAAEDTLQSEEEDESFNIDIDKDETSPALGHDAMLKHLYGVDKDAFTALKRSERWQKVEDFEETLLKPLKDWIDAEWKAIRAEDKTLTDESRHIKALKKDHNTKRKVYFKKISAVKKEYKKLKGMRGKVRELKKLANY